jgi:PPK2 family polyphosphate:nucleotide phosphotransferase
MNKRTVDPLAALPRLQHADPDDRFDLSTIGPDEQPFSCGDQDADRAAVEALAQELDALQELFRADGRFRMLVLLQGLDTSGKDGTLRHVFGRMSPLGVRVAGWKAPTETERAHDFLWRIHAAVPGDGELTVFNRSHYEDVLVPWVNGELSKKQLRLRYAQINDFERLLCETGTVLLKFMLHISHDEQRRRLQARLDDPTKQWKFDVEDLTTRRHWSAYQRAYESAIRATGTPWAPWTVVPADSKTHRNLTIALVLKREFKRLKLRYPPLPGALKGLRVE